MKKGILFAGISLALLAVVVVALVGFLPRGAAAQTTSPVNISLNSQQGSWVNGQGTVTGEHPDLQTSPGSGGADQKLEEHALVRRDLHVGVRQRGGLFAQARQDLGLFHGYGSEVTRELRRELHSSQGNPRR